MLNSSHAKKAVEVAAKDSRAVIRSHPATAALTALGVGLGVGVVIGVTIADTAISQRRVVKSNHLGDRILAALQKSLPESLASHL